MLLCGRAALTRYPYHSPPAPHPLPTRSPPAPHPLSVLRGAGWDQMEHEREARCGTHTAIFRATCASVDFAKPRGGAWHVEGTIYDAQRWYTLDEPKTPYVVHVTPVTHVTHVAQVPARPVEDAARCLLLSPHAAPRRFRDERGSLPVAGATSVTKLQSYISYIRYIRYIRYAECSRGRRATL